MATYLQDELQKMQAGIIADSGLPEPSVKTAIRKPKIDAEKALVAVAKSLGNSVLFAYPVLCLWGLVWAYSGGTFNNTGAIAIAVVASVPLLIPAFGATIGGHRLLGAVVNKFKQDGDDEEAQAAKAWVGLKFWETISGLSLFSLFFVWPFICGIAAVSPEGSNDIFPVFAYGSISCGATFLRAFSKCRKYRQTLGFTPDRYRWVEVMSDTQIGA